MHVWELCGQPRELTARRTQRRRAGQHRVSRAPLLWARPTVEPFVQTRGDPLDLRLHQQCEQGAQPVLARRQVIAPSTDISLSIAFSTLKFSAVTFT